MNQLMEALKVKEGIHGNFLIVGYGITDHEPEADHDRNLEALLERDASDSGLGAALLQNGRPFASSSRALTIAETNYVW